MATPNGRTPRHGGSHFGGEVRQARHPVSDSARGSSVSGARARDSLAGGATAPHSALSGGRVSGRTAAATRRAGSHGVQRGSAGPRRNPVVPVVAALAVVAAVVAAVVLVVVPRLSGDAEPAAPQLEPGTEVVLTIPEGAGASEVAQVLYEKGLIASTSEFLTQVRKTDVEMGLRSGGYSFAAGMELQAIIDQLAEGPNVLAGRLTVPEGYSVARTASAVEEALGIPAGEFAAQAKASSYAGDYAFLAGVAEDSLEGYLFPKTYDFPEQGTTADAVIRAMLDQYELEVVPLDLASAAAALSERYGIEVDEHDIVTLASIVEREALTDEQRGQIASVFYNRLSSDMPLQSDATLAYSLGREVTADDLKVDDPYNTYLRKGLTPTPICSPSLESLKAAMSPDDTDYVYFFITSDGYSVFSVTYDEHKQAIENRPQ